MAAKIVILKDNLDDVVEEVKALHLPRQKALATYLKNNYGCYMRNMKDKDWMNEAADMLEVLGMAEK